MLLLCRPREAALGAAQALSHWYASVVPALLPFLVLMPLLTCSEAVYTYKKLLGRVVERALCLPGSAASAMVIGMLAGMPAGAIAARGVAVLTVGGYMALFGALAVSVGSIVGDVPAKILLCLLDVPSGARLVAGLPWGAVERDVLLAGMCGFGGICVTAQRGLYGAADKASRDQMHMDEDEARGHARPGGIDSVDAGTSRDLPPAEIHFLTE